MASRGSRYLGILRGSDETARNKLINYLKGVDKVNYPARRVAKPDRTAVYVGLWGIPVAATVKLKQFVNGARFVTPITTFLGTHVSVTPPADAANILSVKGIRSPRAVITTGRSGSGTEDNSQISGLRYLKYGGTGVTCPFGPKNTTETEGEAFAEIKAAAIADNARNTVVYVPGSYVA